MSWHIYLWYTHLIQGMDSRDIAATLAAGIRAMIITSRKKYLLKMMKMNSYNGRI